MSRSGPRQQRRRGPAAARQTPPLRLSAGALRHAWTLIAWSAVIVGAVWGLQHLEQRVVASQPRVPPRLEWTSVPPWLENLTFLDGHPVLATIAAQADLAEGRDLTAPDLCERVGRGLQASPWVREVTRVTKHPDGAVRVAAAFREPVAFVEVNGWAYLVDAEGVRLPPEGAADFRPGGQWFMITGVRHRTPPALGQPWPGEDLAAGLKLARLFRAAYVQGLLPFSGAIRALDVANFDRRDNAFDGRLRVRTLQPQCYIRWGEPPGDEDTIEPSANRKLDMLRTYYVEFGQFPDGQILDVRREEGVKLWPYPKR